MSKTATIKNPGYLKLDLIIRGMKIAREALENPKISSRIKLAQQIGAALELDIVLPENIVVNIPILECLSEDRPYTLIEEEDRFYIVGRDERVEVWVSPIPKYYDIKTSSGVPMVKIGRAYAGYLAISPTPVCEFINQDIACRYCDLEAKKGRAWTVDEVLETVEAAVKEGIAEYICLNVGYTNTPDGGISLLEPYISAIKKRFDVLVCVQAQPPTEDAWIDSTYAMGIDSIAYNLEVYDPDCFSEIAPGKLKLLGRQRYFDALRYAGKIFPSGAVVSNLIIVLEPIESTNKGINALTAMGVIPTLPIYRVGFEETGGKALPDLMAPVYVHLQQALKRNKLSPTWISHFNLALNAIDGHFFGAEAPLQQRWQRVLKSKHGGRIAHSISTFRRRLRVRNVDDDSTPSGF